ncbi:peroxiredoxin [Marivibrio halodurans]|uniref:Glutathione-dependent peroxiredoxin n=1 Tax=Marivibrio halodurans TaxID=2039722 RepID=A0A8J7SPC6_9PROT|nr:peroxiredoxin [Marivibrio halodurans]MBP5858261.1 peroxiredoxin [Marivibrio halodurans]
MIKVGQTIPDATFFRFVDGEVTRTDAQELFAGRKVLVIGVVGAFTPVCGVSHLPEYIPLVEAFQEHGDVDRIVCLCAADPFVMAAWANELGINHDRIAMLTDNNADFAETCGLAVDLGGIGLARRSNRYSMVVRDRVLESLTVEETPYDVDVTSAGNMLDTVSRAA